MAVRIERMHARLWDLSSSSFPYLEKGDRQVLIQRTQAEAQIGGRRRGALELVDRAQRIVLIGGLLAKRNGQAWAEAHPQQMEFLRVSGVSPEDAMQRHAAWVAQELQHEAWHVRDGQGIGRTAGTQGAA